MTPTLPEALTDPPWLRKPKRTADWKAVTVEGLEPPAGRRVRWAPGEREEWSADPGGEDEAHWRAEIDRHFGRYGGADFSRADVIVRAPEHLARPLLAEFAPRDDASFGHWLRPLLARWETDVWDLVVRMAEARPAPNGWAAVPLLGADTARLAAYWLYKLKRARHVAETWFERHGPLAAGYYLVPDALGAAAAPRRYAVHALRHVAAMDAGLVVRAARAYGDEAAAAVERMLAEAPSGVAPAERPPAPPKRPAWADAPSVPRPVLRDGGGELPADAARNLVLLLAIAGRPSEYPGADDALAEVGAICEPASLAAFAWGLFEAWLDGGRPARDGWVPRALGRFGDAGTVRRLAPLVLGWTKPDTADLRSGALRAIVEIGGDAAAEHLNDIAMRARTKTVRDAARYRLGGIAEARGLTAERLADRLAPDLGLDAAGTLVLDYGARRFTAAVDDRLVPFVVDEDGRVRKSLPKPGVRDDAERAAAARERFARLKADVRVVGADRIASLEHAMIAGRGWTPGEFRAYIARHPVVRPIARRLVWRAADGTSFRIAEDGTLADAADEAVDLPADSEITVVHPVLLGEEEHKAWSALFADYEILQPFPQLGRPCRVLTADERGTDRLARYEGAVLPAAGARALLRGGWRQAMASGGRRPWIAVGAGERAVALDLDPGLPEYDTYEIEDQEVRGVRLVGSVYSAWVPDGPPRLFGELPAGAVSEAVTAFEAALRATG
ncbi:DUF4132 domain-containing protein [Actinomadura sp. WAC 06369]|uniref:DUF4132 domain-containing protein n=1 Tax=Actinomadura sp. WAC 06369 TaxID=2203193 RepID=UPI000F77A594|nr:DUF4132 domain-containing protein [Actinomadura sp. WAC 06369]RSN68891.1 hypothetical protein DMH08_09615 [Actinomadura sp. WAC 06369]